MAIYSEEEDPNVRDYNRDLKFKTGQEITINVPFTYTIGEPGPVTGNVIETIKDAKDEVRAEIERGLSSEEVFLSVE